jgi:hypothetical protein
MPATFLCSSASSRPERAFNAAMATDEGAEAMAHDGVLPETLVILFES